MHLVAKPTVLSPAAIAAGTRDVRGLELDLERLVFKLARARLPLDTGRVVALCLSEKPGDA